METTALLDGICLSVSPCTGVRLGSSCYRKVRSYVSDWGYLWFPCSWDCPHLNVLRAPHYVENGAQLSEMLLVWLCPPVVPCWGSVGWTWPMTIRSRRFWPGVTSDSSDPEQQISAPALVQRWKRLPWPVTSVFLGYCLKCRDYEVKLSQPIFFPNEKCSRV